jgi:hypothetical protein
VAIRRLGLSAALRAPRAAILHHPNQRDELPAESLHHCLGTGERQGWDRDVESAYSTFSSTFSKMISWPSAFLVGAEVRVSLLPEIAIFLFWVVPVQSS